jgi:hypothetical protein
MLFNDRKKEPDEGLGYKSEEQLIGVQRAITDIQRGCIHCRY